MCARVDNEVKGTKTKRDQGRCWRTVVYSCFLVPAYLSSDVETP